MKLFVKKGHMCKYMYVSVKICMSVMGSLGVDKG